MQNAPVICPINRRGHIKLCFGAFQVTSNYFFHDIIKAQKFMDGTDDAQLILINHYKVHTLCFYCWWW